MSVTYKPPGIPQSPWHAFLGGAVGGYLVWGKYSSINYQIVLYLTSRVIVGLWKRFHSSEIFPTKLKNVISESHHDNSYVVAAAAVWGAVMFLFEESADVLHPSLKTSMDEIYRCTIH
jgi:peroxisomal membrane protein 4